MPRNTPSPIPMPTAMTPTRIEVSEPTMMRERRSRPNWSVPSGCDSEGPSSLASMDISRGSRGGWRGLTHPRCTGQLERVAGGVDEAHRRCQEKQGGDGEAEGEGEMPEGPRHPPPRPASLSEGEPGRRARARDVTHSECAGRAARRACPPRR